jgi:HK97 family phage portal protein
MPSFELSDAGIFVPEKIETKANRVTQASIRPGLTGGQAQSHFKAINDYLQAFKIDWINACVSVIAYNFGATPAHLMSDDAPLKGEEDHPFFQLMQQPNPYQNGAHFLELYQMYMDLTGNAFISLEERDNNGQPGELYLLNPARMRIIPDPETYVHGYVYDVGTSVSSGISGTGGLIPYEADEIIHIKMSSPLDEYWGMGNVEGMQTTLDIVQAMAQHELSYWQSGGRIIGTLQTDTKLSDEDFERLRAHWRQANSDQKNRVRVAILEQGLKYQPIAEGLRSLDFVNIDKSKRDRCLAVFGVPLPKLGIMEQAQYKLHEADQFFWQETMSPKFDRFEHGIQVLVDVYDDSLRWEFERRNYEDDTEKLQNATLMNGLGCFTVNEIRAYLGADELGADGDIIWTQSALTPVPLEELSKYAEEAVAAPPPPAPGTPGGPPNGTPPPGGGGNGRLPQAPVPQAPVPKAKVPQAKVPPPPKAEEVEASAKAVAQRLGLKFVTEEELERRGAHLRQRALHNKGRSQTLPRSAMDRMRRYSAKRLRQGALPVAHGGGQRHPAVTEAMVRDRNHTVTAAIEKHTPVIKDAFRKQQAALTRTGVVTRLAKLHKNEGESDADFDTRLRHTLRAVWPGANLPQALGPLFEESVRAGYSMGERVLPPRKRARLWQRKQEALEQPELPVVSEYPELGDRINRQWQAIDDTTFDAILDQLRTGIDRAYSALQIANGVPDEDYAGIQGVFNQASDWRAEMIARTEAANAYNWGSLQAAEDAGVTQVEASDGTDWDQECRDRDGQTFDIGEAQDIRDHPQGTLVWTPLADSIVPPDLSEVGTPEPQPPSSEGEGEPGAASTRVIDKKRTRKRKPPQ